MGVDFFPCDGCGDSICDCGDYVRCEGDGGDCCQRWCSVECARENGGYRTGYEPEVNEESEECGVPSCKYCRDEDVDDSSLLNFVLKTYKLTRKKALKMYFGKKPKKGKK